MKIKYSIWDAEYIEIVMDDFSIKIKEYDLIPIMKELSKYQ